MSAAPTFTSKIAISPHDPDEEDYWKGIHRHVEHSIPHTIVSMPSEPDISKWTFDVRATSYDTESGKWYTRMFGRSISADKMLDMFCSLRTRERTGFTTKFTIPGEKEKEVWVFARSDFQLADRTFKPERGYIRRVDMNRGEGTIWVEKHSLDEPNDTVCVRVSNTDLTGARKMLLYLTGKESTRKIGGPWRETIGFTIFKGDSDTLRRVHGSQSSNDAARQSVSMALAERGGPN